MGAGGPGQATALGGSEVPTHRAARGADAKAGEPGAKPQCEHHSSLLAGRAQLLGSPEAEQQRHRWIVGNLSTSDTDGLWGNSAPPPDGSKESGTSHGRRGTGSGLGRQGLSQIAVCCRKIQGELGDKGHQWNQPAHNELCLERVIALSTSVC